MANDEANGWSPALYEVLRRSRAVPRLIVLPRHPGTTLSRCLPLVLILAMIAAALYDLRRVDNVNFFVAVTLSTGLCLAASWLVSFRPRASTAPAVLIAYRWIYMLIAVFVGTLVLFVAEAVLATLMGWNPPVYTLASQLWPGQTALYDQARLLQFLLLALIAWGFYAAFFRPAVPGGRPRPRETLLAGALGTLLVAFIAALLLQFGVELLIGWVSAMPRPLS